MTREEQRRRTDERAARYLARFMAGETLKMIGEAEGITGERVAQLCERAGRLRRRSDKSPAAISAILCALSEGKSNHAIADEVGVTVGTVAGYRHRRGFKTRLTQAEALRLRWSRP